MNTRTVSAVVGLIIATTAAATAQRSTITRVQPPQPRVRFVELWQPTTTTGDTRIVGTVVDIRQVAVARVKLRLRNLVTGEVVKETRSNENGEYAFDVSDPGTYVVEMVLADGRVVALSNAGSLARYETLQTVVQVAGRWDVEASSVVTPQNVANFVGVSAATTMTANTLTIAAQQNIAAVDAGEPVSP